MSNVNIHNAPIRALKAMRDALQSTAVLKQLPEEQAEIVCTASHEIRLVADLLMEQLSQENFDETLVLARGMLKRIVTLSNVIQDGVGLGDDATIKGMRATIGLLNTEEANHVR